MASDCKYVRRESINRTNIPNPSEDVPDNNNVDTPIDNNLEDILPSPEVALDDQTNHEDLNETDPEDRSIPNELPPLIPRRSNSIRTPTSEFLQGVSQEYFTLEHYVHQPVPYQFPSDAPPQSISFSI